MRKYILLDSKYRFDPNNSSSVNFRYYLQHPIIIKSYLRLKYLLLPRMNYLINNSNNTFNIIINNNTYTITLNNSNYSPQRLCDTLIIL